MVSVEMTCNNELTRKRKVIYLVHVSFTFHLLLPPFFLVISRVHYLLIGTKEII